MKRTALTTLLLVLPLAALALDLEHADDGYSDATSFSVAEQAAISVLTDVDAVSGNPDGSFAPSRTLNRAEFAKIALLSMGLHVQQETSCFPDVRVEQWFAGYVCTAKARGAIQGNPDGLFHPERTVNYVEAVKILVELAGYPLPEPAGNERWAWYTAYLRAALEQGVALPGSIEPDHRLTRGQMARLAAAFVAKADGSLDLYRQAERGIFSSSSSSSSRSSLSSSSSSSSSSPLSSSSSSLSSSPLFPAHNSFLLTGKRSPLILGGTVVSSDEASTLRIVQLTLRREVNSIRAVYLVDAAGQVIVELRPSTNDNEEKKKWEAVTPDSTYTFAADTPVSVGIVFDLWPKDGGGGSNQLVETERFTIQTESQSTGMTKYLLLDSQVTPVHQTAFGRLTQAKSVLPASGTLHVGPGQTIASLRFAAETATGGAVYVNGVELLLSTVDVNVTNIHIGDAASGELASCGLEKLGVTRIVCAALPAGHSWVPGEGLVVSLYADIALVGTQATGQMTVALEGRGAVGTNGSFTWSDTSGQFHWIEESVPFGGDVTWTVVP